MRRQEKKREISSLLALLLFAVFGVCVLLVLLTGADAYRTMRDRGQDSYQRRTAAQYIATKVRQSDVSGGIYAADFSAPASQEEGDTLFLPEETDDGRYCTRIYCYDGYLCELYADADGEFSPEDGEKLLSADSLWFSLSEGVLIASVDGETVVLRLRSGEVAP